MDFEFTAGHRRLREEVRAFLEEELRAGTFQPTCDAWGHVSSREFSRKVGARGWIGMTWPRKYGGQERTYTERLVVTEELLRYGAPAAGHWAADRQMGNSLLAYGSEELRNSFLPRIARGEVFFCIGISEPEAGSDAAATRTRAVENDGYYSMSGQKVWTSGAHESDYCYVLARTDPTVPKHKGLSEFIVDLSLPGITIRPILSMTGEHHFNEVFFDNVQVPKEMLVGAKNLAWYQMARQIDYERSGMERLMGNYPLFDAITRRLKQRREQTKAGVRHKLAELWVEFEVGRLLVYRVAWILDQGKVPNYEAAMAKTYCTEFEQRAASFAVTALGPAGLLMPGDRRAELGGSAAVGHMNATGMTIGGGTSEILRNVIATRGMGLPHG